AVRVERKAVAVEIPPRPRVLQAERRLRIGGVCPADFFGGDIAGKSRLQRGLTGAEHVVGDAQSRVEILPVLHSAGALVHGAVEPVGTGTEVLAGAELAGRQILGQCFADEPVVPQSGVYSQAFDGPA